MDVWLPGSQYAAAGSKNGATSAIDFFVSRGFRGRWGNRERVRTGAGKVSGVVTAGGVGVAGVAGGNEEGEDGYEGDVHDCD